MVNYCNFIKVNFHKLPGHCFLLLRNLLCFFQLFSKFLKLDLDLHLKSNWIWIRIEKDYCIRIRKNEWVSTAPVVTLHPFPGGLRRAHEIDALFNGSEKSSWNWCPVQWVLFNPLNDICDLEIDRKIFWKQDFYFCFVLWSSELTVLESIFRIVNLSTCTIRIFNQIHFVDQLFPLFSNQFIILKWCKEMFLPSIFFIYVPSFSVM